MQEKLKAFEDNEEYEEPSEKLQENTAPPKNLKQKLGRAKEKQNKDTGFKHSDKEKKKIDKLPKKDLSNVSSNWMNFLKKTKTETTDVEAGKTKEKQKKNGHNKRIFPFANNLNPPQDSYSGYISKL